jgi:hypothetical protein
LPLLLRKEKKLRKKFAGNSKAKSETVLQTNPDMRVY